MPDKLFLTTMIIVMTAIILVIFFHIIRSSRKKFYKEQVKELEVQRNQIASTPVLIELAKIEPIIKNEKMEEKYNKWQDRFTYLKDNRLNVINDMLIDLDFFVEKRDYTSCGYRIAKVEIEIYKVREAAEHLLDEIRDVTLSEE